MRILDTPEIKSVPEIPISNPYIERLIGSTRREYIDQTLFWNEFDLKSKLQAYQHYYNDARMHYALDGVPLNQFKNEKEPNLISLKNYRWKKYCHGLYSIPMAARLEF